MRRSLFLAALLPIAFTVRAQMGIWSSYGNGTGSGNTGTFYTIQFPTADTGYISGSSGTVLKTTDGGANWSSVSIPNITTNFLALYFVSGSQGYVAGGNPNKIYTTTDGGANWTDAGSGGSIAQINSIFFPTPQIGYFASNTSVIRRTLNGGTSWQSATVPTTANYTGIHFPTAGTGYAVGSNSALLTSADTGLTWTAMTSPVTATFTSVHFPTPTTGYAVGTGGVILKYTPATGWVAQTSNTGSSLRSVYFLSAGKGFAVGDGGTIVSTVDGGTTWTVNTSGVTTTLRGVFVAPTGRPFAAGFSNVVLRYTPNTPLPVAVTGFAARAAGTANILTWGGSLTGARIVVERSTTGQEFRPLGTVTGSGAVAYSYTDEAPAAMCYYRLRVSGENGEESYSPVALVRRGTSGGTVTLAPQPAAGSLTVTNTDASLNGGIAVVLDIQGREAARFALAPSVTLHVSGWAPGLYALRLPSGEVLRVVKQ